MTGRRKLEELLETLALVRQQPSTPAAIAELRRVLDKAPSLAVAKAAAIVGESGLDGLVPDLVAAFQRFLGAPARSDPGCAAKTAVAEALLRLDQPADELFRSGIRHVQLEPVWGGQVDTAVDLRGAAALGLARTSGAEVVELLAELLADPEPPARVSAARALATQGTPAVLPLLRHKALAGDDEPRVVAECLLALLQVDASGSLAFVAALLQPRPVPGQPPRDRALQAAQALGESRLKEAFALLRDWYPTAVERRLGRAATQAIASLRREEAFEFLLRVVQEADEPDACDAAVAIAEQADAALVDRLRRAAANRPAVADAVERQSAGRHSG